MKMQTNTGCGFKKALGRFFAGESIFLNEYTPGNGSGMIAWLPAFPAEHIEEEKLLLDYFLEERKEEALLMIPEGIEESDLVAYDIIALQDENYKDTYGDINVEIRFGTTYNTEKAMVVPAGFENKSAEQQPYMDWFVLRTEALAIEENETVTDLVRIGLRQLNLPRMEEEPLMLVVISQKLDDRQLVLDDIGENI